MNCFAALEGKQWQMPFPELPRFLKPVPGYWGLGGAPRSYEERHRWIQKHFPAARVRLQIMMCFAARALPVFEHIFPEDARPRQAMLEVAHYAQLKEPTAADRSRLHKALDQAYRAADAAHEQAYAPYDALTISTAFANGFDRRIRAGMAAYACASLDAFYESSPPPGASSTWADDAALAAADPAEERQNQSRLLALFLPGGEWSASWSSEKIRSLTQLARQDPKRAGELADALEQAGCEHELVLSPLRQCPQLLTAGTWLWNQLCPT